MLNLLRDWLLQQGLGGQTVTFVTTAIEIAFVITLAAMADIVARRIIVRQLEKFAGQTSTVWDDIIVKRRVFHRLLHLAPALIIYVFAQPTGPARRLPLGSGRRGGQTPARWLRYGRRYRLGSPRSCSTPGRG